MTTPRGLPAASRLILVCLVLMGLPPRANAQTPAAPEGRSAWHTSARATAQRMMIAAANPAAVEAGLAILRTGGNAIDAAVTVQLVLNLVEPQSSGIGGGALALLWDASAGTLQGFDGRETAPAAARPDRFLHEGQPIPFREAVLSGKSIGVPGTLRLLETLHRRKGRLPWPVVVAPAIDLAERGFPVSQRLHALLSQTRAESFQPEARAYFYDRLGSPRPEGFKLRNPAFAETLRRIAEAGADAFYAGPIAARIAAAATSVPGAPGDLTTDDLASYRVMERAPVCGTYRGLRVCGMGPPSSGGIAVAQVLGLLEPFDLGAKPGDAMHPRALHLIAEAEKLAYADRDHYVADSDFVALPTGLLDSGYLAERRALIDPLKAMSRPRPGSPKRVGGLGLGADETQELAGTSHFSIVDEDRNVLAFTTTIEAGFGSRVWAAGFLLNNEMTDFSLRPVDASGAAIANAIAPGKRPRSSMAPTIVFDAAGKPWAALGSVGGQRIPLYVTKTLIALIDWKLDAQQAATLPNFGSRGSAFEIELDRPGTIWPALVLKGKGHRIAPDVLTSGTHVIVLRGDGLLEGGADPRREGVARGD
jgi:gamma-glutamyltranspeptidase/glutathione hydrolase